jgi:hypothetical protein
LDLAKTLALLDIAQQVILIVGALVLLTVSADLVKGLSLWVIRMLEGYWPPLWRWLAAWLIKIHTQRYEKWENRWQDLDTKRENDTINLKEKLELSYLEKSLHYIPADPNDYMPTMLGNILRMAETQPYHRYGLDAVVCWTRLWPLLPDKVREELGQSRQALNRAADIYTWSILFMLWGVKSVWAIPIGLVSSLIAYGLATTSAMIYADLIEAAFDLYRWELYKALHISLPTEIAKEPEVGKIITEYLWRGIVASKIKFKHPNS